MSTSEWDLAESAGVILFDGNCAFCRNVVGSLLSQLPDTRLRVCSTRSRTGSEKARALGGDPADTFAFVTTTGVYLGPDAYVRLLTLRCGALSWIGTAIAAVPASVRNGAYHWIAKNRPLMSKLFGRGSGTAIPADRFVPGDSRAAPELIESRGLP